MNRSDENSRLLDLALAGDKCAEEELIKLNMPLVKSIAIRFAGRGQETEDLIQIGTLGMLKAVRGFDKKYNTAFSTYAVPLIMGEIKRFLRDDGLIKVSREAKRNNAILMKTKEEFIRNNGRTPHISEMCGICGISEEEAIYAMNACSPSVSLQEKVGDEDGLCLEDLCADTEITDVTEKIALSQAVDKLDENEKYIVYLRYYKGLTQNDTARVLGVNQVKVSRCEKKIVSKLKEFMSESA